MAGDSNFPRPLTYRLALWWAFGFAAVFALYGAVSLILGVLDRQYGSLTTPFGFLVVGLLLAIPAYGLRRREQWGWKGEVAVNVVVIVLALIGFRNYGDAVVLYANVVILALAGVALGLLFAGDTKRYLSARH